MPDETTETKINAAMDEDHSDKPGINALSKAAIECFVAGVRWGQDHRDPLPRDMPEEVETELFELIKHRYREVELALKIAGALELGQLLNKEADQREISKQDADWALDLAAKEYLRLKKLQALLPMARLFDIDVDALGKAEVTIIGDRNDAASLQEMLAPFLTVTVQEEEEV